MRRAPRTTQRDGCPKIVNLGSAKTDLFYERKKCASRRAQRRCRGRAFALRVCTPSHAVARVLTRASHHRRLQEEMRVVERARVRSARARSHAHAHHALAQRSLCPAGAVKRRRWLAEYLELHLQPITRAPQAASLPDAHSSVPGAVCAQAAVETARLCVTRHPASSLCAIR